MNEKLYKNEINLIYLVQVIWNKKKFISILTLIFAIFSVIFSLNLSNIYVSTALLTPSTEEDSLTSKLGSISSLGSLAGISLPSADTSKSQEGVERIKSFEFFSKFFLPNIKLENIMAVKKWDQQNNEISYNEKLFNTDKKEWVRKVKYPQKKIPTSQEAFEVYKEILSISQDKKTSFVRLSIEHKSPNIAKKWLDIIIYQINESMREADQEKAKKSISFLSESQNSTNIQSIKEVSSMLLEKQMQTLMLTSSDDSYVFNIIDSPVVPEKKSKPSRALICILGTMMGMIFALLIIFIQDYKDKYNL
jgi:LPS O-antigen subunit length determinant protein (WzzB/FepE family)